MGRWLATRARAWTGMYLIKGRILGVGVKSWFSAAGNVVQSIRFGECKETNPGTSKEGEGQMEGGEGPGRYVSSCQLTQGRPSMPASHQSKVECPHNPQ